MQKLPISYQAKRRLHIIITNVSTIVFLAGHHTGVAYRRQVAKLPGWRLAKHTIVRVYELFCRLPEITTTFEPTIWIFC